MRLNDTALLCDFVTSNFAKVRFQHKPHWSTSQTIISVLSKQEKLFSNVVENHKNQEIPVLCPEQNGKRNIRVSIILLT